MIKRSGNQLVIFVAFFCILLITACTSQLKDVGIITPIRHSPSIPRFLTIPDNYASIEFGFLNFYKGELKPLPFRLVVKIDASEVLYIYRPTPKDYSGIHKSVPFLSELPDSIKVTNTMELGNTKSGERLVRLKLERPMQFAVIQRAFNDSSFKLHKSSSVEVRDRDKVYEIDVIVPRNANRGIDYHYKQSAYPQLKPDSKLHDTLDSLGVHSIRRVFRRTESQDGEGHIRVTTLKYMQRISSKRIQCAQHADIQIWRFLKTWRIGLY